MKWTRYIRFHYTCKSHHNLHTNFARVSSYTKDHSEVSIEYLHVGSWSRCDGILTRCKLYSSQNRKFRSRPLVWRKVRHCVGKRKICRKNHGAGHCFGKLSCQLTYGTLTYRRKYLFWDWYFPRLPDQHQTTFPFALLKFFRQLLRRQKLNARK